MGKKCIPGVICVENMTLFISLFLGMVVLYLWIRVQDLGNTAKMNPPPPHPIQLSPVLTDPGRCVGGDPLTNPYVPPIKCDSGGRLPINVPTQHYTIQYSQVGILTKQKGTHSEILPLMGRRTITSRNKWQYYTVSGGGNGNLQTKLPVRVKGKSGSGEYGCDEIVSRDEVYVEGYQELFVATMYENGLFSYIPF
jgi:hypothetical protein